MSAALDDLTEGTAAFESVVGELADAEFAAPSLLPGWTRSHVIAHVARNADALVNLLTWAATGIETPMYSNADQRGREIEEGSRLEPALLRADLRSAHERLAKALATLPDERWSAPVRTARGRIVPVAQVPWMRVREVWVHAVDLGARFTFAEVPAAVSAALLDDVAAGFAARDDVPPVRLLAIDGPEWTLGTTNGTDTVAIEADVRDLAAYATGRNVPGPLKVSRGACAPVLPAWL